MYFDLSIFKNIDFTNVDNLLFIAIISIIAIIVFLIFIVILTATIKAVKISIIKIFNIRVDKSEFKQKENIKQSSQDYDYNSPKLKIMGGNFVNDYSNNEKAEGKKQNPTESYEEKEEKSISEGLNRLKGDHIESALDSKMPLREDTEDDDKFEKIEIPKAKVIAGGSVNISEKKSEEKDKFEKIKIPVSSDFHNQPLDFNKNIIKTAGKTLVVKKEDEDLKNIKIPTSSNVHNQSQVFDKNKTKVSKKTLRSKGMIENLLRTREDAPVSNNSSKQPDDSIFGGGEEISRIELRHKLRYDPKIWEAQKDLRMNLSPAERVKLEKETFASVYGRDISKNDLKLNLKRLGKEWTSTTDMKKKEVLRKEIKFFKKIGGIKG